MSRKKCGKYTNVYWKDDDGWRDVKMMAFKDFISW